MILIVDVNADIAHATVALIKCEGLEAKAVYSGAEALAWMAHATPQLIILDDNMPGMTGLELFEQLRLDPRFSGIPVLFHSAEQRRDRHREAVALGALGWFVKGPESWTTMTARVRELLS